MENEKLEAGITREMADTLHRFAWGIRNGIKCPLDPARTTIAEAIVYTQMLDNSIIDMYGRGEIGEGFVEAWQMAGGQLPAKK